MRSLMLVCAGIACVVLGCAPEKEPDIDEKVAAYARAFKARDAKAMDSLLAPDFMVGTYRYPKTGIMVESILKQYNSLDSLKLQKVDTLECGYKLSLKYHFKDKDPFSSYITLDDSLRIRHTRLFDLLYRVDREAPSKLVEEIPFKVAHGAIVLQVRLNECRDTLNMLFDTGADGMAISEHTAERVAPKNIREHSAAVVGGNSRSKFSSGNTLHLGKLSLSRMNTAIFPEINRGLDGIVGGSLLSRYITEVNFDTQTIRLYTLGAFSPKGNPSQLEADYSSGIPVVNLDLSANGQEFNGGYAFDTGAGYNIISYGPVVKRERMLENFQADYYASNVSFGSVRQISVGKLDKLCIEDFCFEQLPSAIQDYQESDSTWATHDGSLGFDLINRFNFTADRLNQCIYLEPNNSYDRPVEFKLGDLVLGFDHEENLVIKTVLSRELASDPVIRPGIKVLSVNDQGAEEFSKQENKSSLEDLSPSHVIELVVETDEKEAYKISI